MTLILDIDIELGLSRARQRSEPDRFEGETIAFFQRVRGVYQELAASAPERYTLVDAGQPLAAVQEDITQVLVTDRKSTRLNSSHVAISYAVFCLKKKR